MVIFWIVQNDTKSRKATHIEGEDESAEKNYVVLRCNTNALVGSAFVSKIYKTILVLEQFPVDISGNLEW